MPLAMFLERHGETACDIRFVLFELQWLSSSNAVEVVRCNQARLTRHRCKLQRSISLAADQHQVGGGGRARVQRC
jgi:hypothetical protein